MPRAVIARSIARGQNIEIGRMIQMLRELDETEAVEIEVAGLVAVKREPDLLPRVLPVAGKEVQEDHVDVLDLVISGMNRLFG